MGTLGVGEKSMLEVDHLYTVVMLLFFISFQLFYNILEQ